MRVGLLRHFPVQQDFPTGWTTAGELRSWLDRYNEAPVTAGHFDLGGVDWKACWCSPLPRARTTARAVFRGPIEVQEHLAEIEFTPFRTGRLRLPLPAWRCLVQAAWWIGHSSQRACRDDFRRRVAAVADRLVTAADDTLVVSHAGMMAYLGAELRQRGFRGPRFRLAAHARVYLFERGS